MMTSSAGFAMSAMEPKPLGSTEIMVNALSLGTPRVGKDQPIGAAPSEIAVRTAVDMLCSDFLVVDTSNNYGDGRSEIAIGRALQRLGGLPKGHTVATKADAEPGTGVFDAGRVKRSFEESTHRLGIDHFPIYHLHDPYSITVQEAGAKGGAIEGLLWLKEQGLIGSVGVATGPVEELSAYLDTGAFDVLLTHNRYTLLDRSAEDLIASAAARNIAVFNAAPFGGGLLASANRTSTNYAYMPASPEVLTWLARLEAVCADWDVALPAAAVQFSMRNPNVSSTVVGTTKSSRLPGFAAMVTAAIPEAFWTAVSELGTPPLASAGVAGS